MCFQLPFRYFKRQKQWREKEDQKNEAGRYYGQVGKSQKRDEH